LALDERTIKNGMNKKKMSKKEKRRAKQKQLNGGEDEDDGEILPVKKKNLNFNV